MALAAFGPALTGWAPDEIDWGAVESAPSASHWFLVLTDVSVGVGKAQLESVLVREGRNLRVVSRTRVTEFIQPAG